jgi:hypothetical protein
MFIRTCFVLLLCAAQASADALSELRSRLEGLQSQEPVKASVELHLWRKSGSEKQPVVTQGKANAWVEDSAQGTKLFWSRGLLQQAAQEALEHSRNPEKTTPTRSALESLSALDVAEYLNSAGHLAQNLEKAQLQEDRADTLDGKPARLLVCKLSPAISEHDKKYIKEFEATAKIWLGEDGLPLATETKTKVRIRAMLVISIQSEESEAFRFQRVGKRLVTVQHVKENRGSGGGESGQSKTTTTITLAQN